MNRGDRREALFEDDRDRERFLQTLEEACEKTGWQVSSKGSSSKGSVRQSKVKRVGSTIDNSRDKEIGAQVLRIKKVLARDVIGEMRLGREMSLEFPFSSLLLGRVQ
jgi:hypothetical protein